MSYGSSSRSASAIAQTESLKFVPCLFGIPRIGMAILEPHALFEPL